MDKLPPREKMQGISGRQLRIALALAAALCAVALGNRSVGRVELSIPTAKPGSLVAVADLHGDLDKAIQALQLLSIVDQHGRWIAKRVTVVQLGDLVDRGPSSLDVIKYMHSLQDQALQHQSQLVLLLGNHELMNLNGDFRYVAPEELINLGKQQQQQSAAAGIISSPGTGTMPGHQPWAAVAAVTDDTHITTAAAYSAGLKIWAALWAPEGRAAVQLDVVQGSAVQQAVQQGAVQLQPLQQQQHARQLAGSAEGSATAVLAETQEGTATAAANPGGSVRSSILARHQLIATHRNGSCATAFVHAGLLPQVLQEMLLLGAVAAAQPAAVHTSHQRMQLNQESTYNQLGTAAAAVHVGSSNSGDGNAVVGVVTADELQTINTVMRQAMSACDTRACSNGSPLLQRAMALLGSGEGPVWARHQAQGYERRVCDHLQQVLQQLGVQRLVVGHTPQTAGRATTRCNGRLLLLDTGMSSGMMGNAAAAWICLAADGHHGVHSRSNDALGHSGSSSSNCSSRAGDTDCGSGNSRLATDAPREQQQPQPAEQLWHSFVAYADGRVTAV